MNDIILIISGVCLLGGGTFLGQAVLIYSKDGGLREFLLLFLAAAMIMASAICGALVLL